jgi:hypothetical protein
LQSLRVIFYCKNLLVKEKGIGFNVGSKASNRSSKENIAGTEAFKGKGTKMEENQEEWVRLIYETQREEQRARRLRIAIMAGMLAMPFASTLGLWLVLLNATDYFQLSQPKAIISAAYNTPVAPVIVTKSAISTTAPRLDSTKVVTILAHESPAATPAKAAPTISTSTPLAPKPSNTVSDATKTLTPTTIAPTVIAALKPAAIAPKPTETAKPTEKPTTAPAKPTNPPLLTRSQAILVPATSPYGAKFAAPVTGVYRLQFVDGAFSSWPSNGPWRTIIHIYKNRPIQWGWRIWQDKRFYEPINPDISIGSFQDYLSAEQAANGAKRSSPVEVSLNAESWLAFVYIDEQGAYADNRGSATLQVSWNQ